MVSLMVSDEGIFFIGDLEVIPVINPLLLNKLKLASDTCTYRHKDNAVIAIVAGILVRLAVRKSPAQQPPAVDQSTGSSKGIFNAKFQGTTRVHAANVGAKGATAAC